MFCPKCGAEYRVGFAQCSDCLIPLVHELPEPVAPPEPVRDSRTPRPHLELVKFFVASEGGLVALAKSLLQSADIEFMVRGEGIQDLFGLGRLGFNPITGPVEFLVAAEDADDARGLLADLEAGDHDVDDVSDDGG